VLASTANLANAENPSQVTVSRPSDVLVARAADKGALNSLFLGLGAVSLLIGAIGVGNIMLISVLERRSGDRTLAGPGRYQNPHPRAVPHRSDAALTHRRHRPASHSASKEPPDTPTPTTASP